MCATSHLLTHAILVDGPDRGNVSLEELGSCHRLVGCPGNDQPGLAHRAVAHHDALDQFLTGQLVVHIGSWSASAHTVLATIRAWPEKVK